jgi:hypothetical protein
MRYTTLYEREIVMLQQAIIFTKDNFSDIADSLIDFTDHDLLNEYGYLFYKNEKHVLVRSVCENEIAVLSHVVTESMFYANARTTAELNDKTFVDVVQL